MTKPSITPETLLPLLHGILMQIFTIPDFEVRWKIVEDKFLSWIRGLPAPLSPLMRNLELLRILCQSFDSTVLKQNQNVLQVILDGTLEDGNFVRLKGVSHEVIRRDIGENFGVAYTLKNQNGDIIRYEFFD